MLWAVSRAPLAKLQPYKRRMGWSFPWASSFNSDFNFDFNVQVTEQQQREGGAEYNYRREPAADAHRALEGRQTGQWREDSESGDEGPVAEMAARCGIDANTYIRERPGMSAFVLEDGVVYHTYSTYSRGLDGLWGMYQWLDRAPKGVTRRAFGGSATTSMRGILRTPARVATRRRRTREHWTLLPHSDSGPRQPSSAGVAMAAWR
jgi:predicted dithiol-disulfide oxidoreductase (DUF899 family)